MNMLGNYMDERDYGHIPYEVGKNKRVTLVILSEAKDLSKKTPSS